MVDKIRSSFTSQICVTTRVGFNLLIQLGNSVNKKSEIAATEYPRTGGGEIDQIIIRLFCEGRLPK